MIFEKSIPFLKPWAYLVGTNGTNHVLEFYLRYEIGQSSVGRLLDGYLTHFAQCPQEAVDDMVWGHVRYTTPNISSALKFGDEEIKTIGVFMDRVAFAAS